MSPRRSLLTLLICGPILCFPGVAHAQCAAGEVAIPADRDNTLYEDAAGDLSNGAGDFVFSGNTNGNGLRRALLHFDVAGAVPAGSTVTSATLRLNMSMTIAGAEDLGLYPVLADWGEGTSDAPLAEGGGTLSTAGDATWLHTFYNTSFWTTPGGDFFGMPSATASVAGVGPYAWGSTAAMVADVQGWLDDPASNYGWILVGNEAVTVTAKRFDSRDHTAAGAVPPVLCAAALAPAAADVPTLGPWALALLALALAGLAVRRVGHLLGQ